MIICGKCKEELTSRNVRRKIETHSPLEGEMEMVFDHGYDLCDRCNLQLSQVLLDTAIGFIEPKEGKAHEVR